MRRRFFQTHKNNVENLTIVSLEDNNEIYLNVRAIDITGEIEMKISGDYKWMPNGAVILNKGDFIEYRGTISNISPGQDRIGTFVISKKVNLYGDCTSILKDRMLFNNSLAYLFENTPVVNIHSTFLPATTLAYSCYSYMFYGCSSLTTAPELPAITLKGSCYYEMFYGCSSLTTAPELPATTLADSCYRYMFYGCSSLTTAPELPATTLADSCYQYMFNDCTSLINAPELPATTLASYCYYYMFYGCRSLNYIKMLATDISATNCLNNWVKDVPSTGTFVKNPDMNSLPTGISGIPEGWTVVNDGEESGGGSSLTFPVTLVDGDNGQLGIDLFNYLIDKYGRGYYGEIEEDVFIPNNTGGETKVIEIDITFSITFHGEAALRVLRNTGILD